MTVLARGGLAESARNGKPARKTCAPADSGEFGSPLDFLRQHYSAPQGPGESNYFIDLWANQELRSWATACKLTNNHALFVNSHGKSLATRRGTQYAFYPHQSLLGAKEAAHPYSAADLARVLGVETASGIHNLILSGCNIEGAFSSQEFRKYFVNATNIIHMAAGELGYQSMFRQLLTSPSGNIEPVYETCAKTRSGRLEYFTAHAPSAKATKLTPYIAELFEPGALNPFRTQRAGREILSPIEPLLSPSMAEAN